MVNTTFDLYSPRWGHGDPYHVILDGGKFDVSLNGKEAQCVIDDDGNATWTGHQEGCGNTFLNILSDDMISAPASTPEMIEYLTSQHKNGAVSDDAATELFAWINHTTEGRPISATWRSYMG